jgi:hypothetical protein
VELPAVRRLLADALGGPAHAAIDAAGTLVGYAAMNPATMNPATMDPATMNPAGTDTYGAGAGRADSDRADSDRIPEQAHAACMALLRAGGRHTAMAPGRYVLCAGPPADPADTAGWLARPVLAAGPGRQPHFSVPEGKAR